MAYRFPLQAVLHFRESLEHQQELLLRAVHQQIARMRHMMEQLDGDLKQVQRHCANELNQGTTAAELQFVELRESAIYQQRQKMDQQLSRLEQLREQQQRIFQQARRDRETLEGLRDRQLLEYTRISLRREQRSLDDLFLLRRSHLKRS